MNQETTWKGFDENTIKTINESKDEIYETILNFLKDSNTKQYNISDFFSSRIKSDDSIINKLKKKNKLDDFEKAANKDEYILKNIKDIVGFRIECWFFDEEKQIYKEFEDKFQSYLEEKRSPIFDIKFDESELKQSNGFNIYKFKCSIKKNNKNNKEIIIPFEIQIKSSMHAIWGEIEHKKIYKNYNYSILKKINNNNMKSIHDILKSSNEQLKSIWLTSEDEDDLIKSLFYNKSKYDLKDKNFNKGFYYEKYFNSFYEIDFIKQNIKSYISKKLVNENWEKNKTFIEDDKFHWKNNEEILKLKQLIEEKYPITISNLNDINNIIFNNKNNVIDLMIYKTTKEYFDDSKYEYSNEYDAFDDTKSKKNWQKDQLNECV